MTDFTTDFMNGGTSGDTGGLDTSLSASAQGQLSSSYTNWLTGELTTDAVADYIGWLYFNAGNTVEDALAVVDAVKAGEFTLDGLFGAAQSKTAGPVDPAGVPIPTLTLTGDLAGISIDLTAILGGLDTETWSSGTGTKTVYHTREFYTETDEPEFYDPNWANPVNQTPTDITLTIDGDFAAAAGGQTAGGNDAPLSNTTGSGIVVGTLSAADSDVGDSFTYEIVGTNPGDRFVIDGDQLLLADGEAITSGDGTFGLTIKVTDSADNTFYETFTFKAGTSAVDPIDGTSSGGAGTEEAPKVGDDVILGFGQNDDLDGLSGDDAMFGGRGSETANPIVGGTGNDQLFGGVNNDVLIGGAGDDVLTGGQGEDVFRFTSTADGIDSIVDFTVADDTIQLDNASFTQVGANGTLDVTAFHLGSLATQDADDRITYDDTTGAVYYDANGSAGVNDAIQIAQMATGLTVTQSDFFII
jgi:Ca2+-binding RTX toxin-like protein